MYLFSPNIPPQSGTSGTEGFIAAQAESHPEPRIAISTSHIDSSSQAHVSRLMCTRSCGRHLAQGERVRLGIDVRVSLCVSNRPTQGPTSNGGKVQERLLLGIITPWKDPHFEKDGRTSEREPTWSLPGPAVPGRPPPQFGTANNLQEVNSAKWHWRRHEQHTHTHFHTHTTAGLVCE